MKVVIVGGTGNISTAIVQLLLETGHEVICYNRGEMGKPPQQVRVIQGDRFADTTAFEQAMQSESFDAAIDMICFNAEHAQSSLRAFRGVGQFVMCSTIATYGIDYDWMPVTEDHPLRPTTEYGRGKVAADAVFLAAYYGEDFPVTIIKPATTFGPTWNLLRQIRTGPGTWVDRIRKGKPIVVCGNGDTVHQFMSVADAAPCFAGVLGKPHCIGQTYNMVKRGFTSWNDYHCAAMKIVGREVEMVAVSLADLVAAEVPGIEICRDIFAHNLYADPDRLYRDVPEFNPQTTIENIIAPVVESMDRNNRTPNCDEEPWEDNLIEAQRRVSS